MKDRYRTELVKGSKVIFISKSYGYNGLRSVRLGIGIVDKVTAKTITINSVKVEDNQIIENTTSPIKIVSNCYGGDDWDGSDAVMVVDEFPKAAIDYLKNKEN